MQPNFTDCGDPLLVYQVMSPITITVVCGSNPRGANLINLLLKHEDWCELTMSSQRIGNIEYWNDFERVPIAKPLVRQSGEVLVEGECC